MVVSNRISFSKGLFSGAMLVSGRVVFFFEAAVTTFSFANVDGWLMRAPCSRPEIVRAS